MGYEGVERRKASMVGLSHEELMERISELHTSVAVNTEATKNLDKRINGALDGIAKHIDHGERWRASIIAIIATLLINIATSIWWASALGKVVEINTARITKLEDLHPRKGNDLPSVLP
jgi:hypothetical protein